MIVKVQMWAFQDGIIREVEIPDDTPADQVLETAFHFGQNDFQPRASICSVSVGDVIEHDGFHMISPVGFVKLSSEELADYTRLGPNGRWLIAHKLKD